MSAMADIAFLGTGTMGREMALHLLAAGHRVAVYNRSPAKLNPLVEAGARPAATPAEAARGATVIVSMVGDDDASRSVWLGPDGVLAGGPAPGALAVESATLSHAWVLELAAAVRAAGLRYIDCPVTGGPDGARDRRLTLLVGAEPEDLAAAWPVLSAYASRHIHFGPVGSGTAYKLVVNLIGAVQAVALAEGVLVAEAAGLPLDKVGLALSSGAVASPHVKYLIERMVANDHDDIYFTARWRHKDAAYGLALAESLGRAMPTSRPAVAAFARALDKGWGDRNSSVVIDALRDLPKE